MSSVAPDIIGILYTDGGRYGYGKPQATSFHVSHLRGERGRGLNLFVLVSILIRERL